MARNPAGTLGSRPLWRVSPEPVPYPAAVAEMERAAAAIARGVAPELVWLLEHPPLYTAGTSAKPSDLLDAGGLPVFASGRGGQYTYHGPGQRVAYVMLDLRRRGADIRRFVRALEEWAILALADLGVAGLRRPGQIGVWVGSRDGSADKIAAIGVRVRRGVTYHGLSINVDPDLAHYRGIVPCGVRAEGTGLGVTSLARLGVRATMADLDAALRRTFEPAFAQPRAE